MQVPQLPARQSCGISTPLASAPSSRISPVRTRNTRPLIETLLYFVMVHSPATLLLPRYRTWFGRHPSPGHARLGGSTWMRFFFVVVPNRVDQYADAMTGRFSQLVLGE